MVVSPHAKPPKAPLFERIRLALGMDASAEAAVWLFLMVALVPASFGLRLWFWANPLLGPDAGSQTATALRAVQLHTAKSGLFDRTGGGFPMYEWLTARMMDVGFSVEYASRFLTLLSFLGAGALLVTLVGRSLGRRTAYWTGLLWLVSPINILYSRACIPDFGAVLCLFAAGKSFLDVHEGRRPDSLARLVGIFFLGSLAAIMAPHLWLAPAAASLVLLVRRSLKPGLAPSSLLLGLAVLGQGAMAAVWVSNQSFAPPFGSWNWSWGMSLLEEISLGVFHGWMLVPFVLALLLGRKENRRATLLLLFFALAPIFVAFAAFGEHEARLAGVTAYFLVLAALGMERLFHLPPSLRGAWIGIALAPFVWRLGAVRETFDSVERDYRENLASARKLKTMTSPEDLIYYGGASQDAHLALYAQRTVESTTPDRAPAGESRQNFSVFLFDKAGPDLAKLAPFDPIWIDSAPELSLYRVAPKGKFSFDRSRSLGVGNYSARMPDYFFDDTGTLRLKALPHPSAFLVIELVRPGRSISVKAVDADLTYVFPKKDFVFLPAPQVARPETYEITLVP